MNSRAVVTILSFFFLLSCSLEKKIQKAFDNGQYQNVIDYSLPQLPSDPGNTR